MNRSVPAYRRACRSALGTFVEIAIHEDDLPVSARDQQHLFEMAFNAIGNVERSMSFHDPASELSQINALLPGTTIAVGNLIHTVLSVAARLHHLTDGAFDCGVGRHLVTARLLPRHQKQNRPCDRAAGSSGLADICLNADNTLTVLKSVCLDLGGIAKGFAVDQAIELLTKTGLPRCIVNAGGDLRISSEASEQIVLRHPAAPRQLVTLGTLSDGAVATSAPYYSLQSHDGKDYCALFDPVGQSLTHRSSYTVLAPQCIIADALTKAVAVHWHRNRHQECTGVKPGRHASAPEPFHAGYLEACDAQAFIF